MKFGLESSQNLILVPKYENKTGQKTTQTG
jgi:hypothetical protein